VFRDYVCIPIAQLYHFYEVRLKMAALNLGQGKVTKVPKLTDSKAVEQGSELLSEIIILGIASSLLIYEYQRSSEKDQAKEERLRADRETIKAKIFELELQVERQSVLIRQLAQTALEPEGGLRALGRRLLGEQGAPGAPDLRAAIAEIPGEPRQVRPLQLLADREEEEAVEKAVAEAPVTVKTPIQQLVETRFARPAVLPVESLVEAERGEERPVPGIVTGAVESVLAEFPAGVAGGAPGEEGRLAGALRRALGDQEPV
jgi:hypothetical protein